MHGSGVFTYDNGDKWEGTFDSDMLHGKGYFTWSNGRKLPIEFQNHFPVIAHDMASILCTCFISVMGVIILFTYDLNTLVDFFEAVLDPHQWGKLVYDVIGATVMTKYYKIIKCPPEEIAKGAVNCPFAILPFLEAVISMIGKDRLPYYIYTLLLVLGYYGFKELFAFIVWKCARIIVHSASYNSFLLSDLNDSEGEL
jgi:hypothetical protein